MKTCPNCGAKMGLDVNFCTSCGTDIRNVAPDADTSAQPQANQSQENTQEATQSTSVPQEDSSQQQVQPDQPQAEQPQQNYQNVQNQNAQQTDFNEKAAVAKKNASNMWNWFLASLKKPFATKSAEKWYGWVLLLAENILLILGLYLTVQNEMGRYEVQGEFAARISSFSNTALFQLLLCLLLLIAGAITVTYYVRKWIYGVNENFFDVVNRIASASAISAVLYVLIFIFLLIGSFNTYKYAAFTFVAAFTIIFLACYAITVSDENPINDKFYGLLIVFVATLVINFILFKLFGQNIVSQFEQIFHIDLSFLTNLGGY